MTLARFPSRSSFWVSSPLTSEQESADTHVNANVRMKIVIIRANNRVPDAGIDEEFRVFSVSRREPPLQVVLSTEYSEVLDSSPSERMCRLHA